MIKTFAKESGFNDIEILKDIGSGLKEDRKGFQKLLKMVMNRRLSKVIIASKTGSLGLKPLSYSLIVMEQKLL
ncbi:MAG: hypothetical protein F7B11_01965 [Caldisphaeraceae archaeon]|nr:hypothetical protein [Caldisphaeraceae archaeon]